MNKGRVIMIILGVMLIFSGMSMLDSWLLKDAGKWLIICGVIDVVSVLISYFYTSAIIKDIDDTASNTEACPSCGLRIKKGTAICPKCKKHLNE